MHNSAFLACLLLFQTLHHLLLPKYQDTDDSTVINILDVGSFDVNGNNRDCISLSDFGNYRNFTYIGIDLSDGPNVDVVYEPGAFPFTSPQFDIILSTSCLEHDSLYWLTFLNLARALHPGGILFINVPAGSEVHPIHRYPVDNWRFFPDAAYALSDWSVIDMSTLSDDSDDEFINVADDFDEEENDSKLGTNAGEKKTRQQRSSSREGLLSGRNTQKRKPPYRGPREGGRMHVLHSSALTLDAKKV